MKCILQEIAALTFEQQDWMPSTTRREQEQQVAEDCKNYTKMQEMKHANERINTYFRSS